MSNHAQPLYRLRRRIAKIDQLKALYRLAMIFPNLRPRDLLAYDRNRLTKKVWPYTMVSYAKLRNMYDLAADLEQRKVPGAFVECGTWKGGCIAVAAEIARRHGDHRHIWLFDSFQGNPEPTTRDGDKATKVMGGKAAGRLVSIDQCVASVEDAEEILFKKLHFSKAHIHIVPGWFQDTLPAEKTHIGPVALLRLDGNWYESDRCVLDHLFDLVVPGGYVILDDYGYWQGSRQAFQEFVAERGLSVDLKKIDGPGRYFLKS